MAVPLVLETLRTTTLTFATLFPIVNPIGIAPIFQSLTYAYPEPVRKTLVRRIAIYGFLLLVGSLVLGPALLNFFGISLPVIEIAGGFVLANTGWSMLNKAVDGAEETLPGSVEHALQRAFYPLTLPLTVGPGCISVAVGFGAHIRQQSTIAKVDAIPLFLGAVIGMILVCLTLSLCYAHAGKLTAFLGPSGTNIVVRLSAFLLLTIGVQIMWNGFHPS